MADYLVRCECGVETPVSEWAIGAPLRCKGCKRPLEPTKANTRLAPEEEPKRPRQSDLPISPEGRMHARRESAAPGPKPATPSRPAAPLPPTPVPTAPEETEAPVRATNCARCGRVFRGDWDRYIRASGVLCHVCANRAPEKPGEETEAAPVAPAPTFRGVEYKGVLDHPVLPRQDDVTPADHAERQASIQKWVLLAAIVTLALVVIAIATDKTPLPTADVSTTGEAAPELPAWATVAVFATLFVFRGLTLGLALYTVLHWRDRLPSDFLPANIITLGAWALGLQLLQVAMSVVPLGGLIWIGVCVYILWDQFDLSPTDFALIAVFLFLLQPLVMVLHAVALATIGYFVL